MKNCFTIWLSLTVIAITVPGSVATNYSRYPNTTKTYAESPASPSLPQRRRTLDKIVSQERRFVLFNSRHLSGECIPICETMRPSMATTLSPSGDPTWSPTNFPDEMLGLPGGSRTNPPSKRPTISPVEEPTELPTKQPTSSPTKEATKSPTKTPTTQPTNLPSSKPIEGVLDCQALENLGHGFSEATGSPHYSRRCYPEIKGAHFEAIPGNDDSVAVFAGGDFIGRRAAEVEGNLVVLGDLKVETNGPGNFVSVGVGTHVLPNSGGDCIIVGGDISADRSIQVFNQATWMKCDIVYKGAATNLEHWKIGRGSKRHEPNYDMSRYEKMKYVFMKKSQYWKTLPSTATVNFEDWGNPTGETNFICTSNNEVQVFNIMPNQHDFLSRTHDLKFGDDCEGKTILINVHGDGAIHANAAAMSFKTRMGYGEGGFPTCMTSSIMWNFPDAAAVDLGNGRTSEWHGSVLVGSGDLTLSTSGHSGRAIVVGNIYHDSDLGSEFHSYPFDPPIPLPDPDDICVLPSNWRSYPAIPPYPTTAPTTAPTHAGCVHIPQSDLPSGSWETDDANCSQCSPSNPGGPVSWWPCNLNPPICQGDCVLS